MPELSAPYDLPRNIDLPTVQAGSIVSRKLITEGPVRVVAFAFAAGEELTEHTTPMEARLAVLSGRIQVTVAEEVTEAQAGDSVDLPAGVPHAVRAIEDSQAVLFMERAG